VASDYLVEIYDAAYSRFCLAVPPTTEGVKALEERHEQIRRARWALKISRAFDFELTFEPAASVEELRAVLEQLREGIHTPQLVGGVAIDELEESAAIARQFQITLTFPHQGRPAEGIQAIAKATGGRFDYRVRTVAEAEIAAEYLL
jgi:hypothetical protein